MAKQTQDSFIIDHQPVFFTGVCESRNDPLKLGRVKVRIFGLHTDDFTLLNPDDLPWALILIPATEAGSSGIGTSKGGILPGTWVFGLFLDGEAKQQPLILGSLQGKPSQPEKSEDAWKRERKDTERDEFKEKTEEAVDLTKGFFDQHEEFLSGYPRPGYTSSNEPDHNRLSRAESLDKTIEELKKLDIEKNIKTGNDRFAEDAQKWEEPFSGRDTTYPYNTVYETESGIIEESDDTPYSERIHNFFKPGHSYVEWGMQGKGYEFKKTWGDTICVQFSPEQKNFLRGRLLDTKDGDTFNTFAKTKTTEIFDTETKVVYDSIKLRALGQLNQFVGGDYILQVNNDIRINANNQMDLDVGSKYREAFHNTHHSVYWMRQYIWNEGQVHIRRKRNYYEKNNESYHSIVIDNRRDLVAVGDKDSTVASNYKLWVGAGGNGFFHSKIDGDQIEEIKGNNDIDIKMQKAERVSKDIHYTFEGNQFQLTSSNKNTIVGKDNIKVVVGKEEKKIQGDNRILIKSNRDIAVEKTQQLEVGKSYKRGIHENDEEKVQKDQILNVIERYLQKVKIGVNEIETWWHKVSNKNIIELFEQAWIKRRDHLYESVATHVLATLSLRVEDKANIVIDRTVGIHIKEKLLLRADRGIILSSPEGDFIFGCKNNFVMGVQSGGMFVKAPNLIITPDDIVIPAERASYPVPKVEVDSIDLKHLKGLSPPQVPDTNTTINKDLDASKPLAPASPNKPNLPEKSKIGEFVNNRMGWEKEEKLSRFNDVSTSEGSTS